MTGRARAFRGEIQAALRLGVSRSDVAEVIVAVAGDPDLDADMLRTALLQYAPAGAFHIGDPDRVRRREQRRENRAAEIEAMLADRWLTIEVAAHYRLTVKWLENELSWMRHNGYAIPFAGGRNRVAA